MITDAAGAISEILDVFSSGRIELFIVRIIMKFCVPFSVPTLDIDAVQSSFSKIGRAIGNHNYIEAADFASATIDQIERSLLYPALQHRAYAFGMQGKFDAAVKDTERSITLDPRAVSGYSRLGNLYAMQGKSFNAIDAYGKGLQNVPPTDPNYNLLLREKSVAIEQSNKHIDFVAMLPVEIVHYIFNELPRQSLSTCLEVSGTWRKRLLECPLVWNDLETSDDIDDKNITSSLPHIARHVECLTLCTENRRAWDQYLINMRDGRFTKVKEIYITELSTRHINTAAPASTLTAFWQIRTTLTVLHLDFDTNAITTMTIVDALFVCHNLKELAYKTDTRLSDALGDLTILRHSAPLLNSLQVQVRAASGIGSDIEPLLQKCQHLRRLVLDGCLDTVLDAISKHCPALELFGYNTDSEIRDLDQDTGSIQPSGLRTLCSTSGLEAIPVKELLPLLKKNMKTLDTIYADICPENDPFDGALYADLKFPKLKALKYWSDDNGGNIERMILRSLSGCTTLTHFEALNTTIVGEIVDTLLTLPPVRTLNLADTDEKATAHTNLIRLFQKYSIFSHTTPCLDTVCLRYCASVHDSVLAALGEVKTLRNIALSGLDNVTSSGLSIFLAKLGAEVQGLALASMANVTDNHLIVLGAMQGLTEVHLENLPNITNYGVIYMIDSSKKLQEVLIKGCKWVTDHAVEFVSCNVEIDFDEAPTLS